MREKIARALYHSKPRNRPYDLLGQHARQYDKQADAVLEALAEPTEAMEFIGGIKAEEMLFGGDPEATGVIFTDMGTVFRTMIQAAKDGK